MSFKVTVTEPDTRFWVGTRDVFEKFVTKNMRDDAGPGVRMVSEGLEVSMRLGRALYIQGFDKGPRVLQGF